MQVGLRDLGVWSFGCGSGVGVSGSEFVGLVFKMALALGSKAPCKYGVQVKHD